ncbi:2-amino-4-hydroxy-6-hydroxymethyldihydropteridine diphosphokinase [Allokutzneria multivorans]|uniref:2-amino-4-hydroxy-6-hydroxymethyldihydropteridine diphosphokinase n=1 Tax=Allokutzneria multivorans TaxID=1142134 RepID=A0ABP7R9S3_9PSEU
MSRAVLSLGSNMGDRLGFLQAAVDGFRPELVAVSSVYETAPWGGVEQEDFLNAVLVVEAPDADEWYWLRRGQDLEEQAGRERLVRWGPRVLDVDVVAVDGIASDHPDLLLPHPGTPDRATVLLPWLDVEPDAVLPGHGSVRDLLARLSTDGVHRRTDLALT